MNKPNRAFVIIALILSVVTSPFAAFGQRTNSVASTRKAASSKCSGAWTGTVSYSRTQSMSDNKTVKRVSGRGEDTTNFEMKYNYNARVAVVEDPSRNGSSSGKASIEHSFSAIETVRAVESNSCDRGKTWKQMTGTSTSQSQTTGNASTDANVSIGVNMDGTYSVSVGLPPIKGESSGKQTSQYSGQCSPKEGKNLTMPPTETSIDGNSLTSDGSHRVDPSDPNRLSGSFTRSFQNVSEKITWSLQKCGADLRIIDLKFEDMVFPNWNEWRELNEQTGTIDGNFVKIKAKVLNASGETKYAAIKFKETYKGDKWDGARPDAELKDNEVSVRVEAGEEREVEVMWDTAGYSWYDDGRPRLVQRVKAEVWESEKKTDEMTKNVKVAPKPLLLVHGLWSNWRAWETWQNILTTSHSYDWKAFPVGEKPGQGIMNTGGGFLSTDPTNSIEQNAEQLKRYIEYAQRDRNAWHVDVVAHSMGGLITRDYINRLMPLNSRTGRPQIAHLVMLGTPNMGSPCADVMNTAFEFLGKNVEAVRQLRQDVAAEFNQRTVNRKGVKFSVLAGDPLPTMCKSVVWNDGVVPVASAVWQIADNGRSKSVHTDLTGTKDFSDFVKPRLAIGPKGDHNPAPPTIPNISGANGVSIEWLTSNLGSGPFVGAASPTFTTAIDGWVKGAKVKAGETAEFTLPIDTVANFGITFMAPGGVTAELYDPSGKLTASSKAGTSEARSWFRSLYVDKNISRGEWKVKFVNTTDFEVEIVSTAWADARQ